MELCSLIHHIIVPFSSNPVLAEMFPDGDKHVQEVTKRPESAGTHFKNSIISLVDNLATKVSLSIAALFMCRPVSLANVVLIISSLICKAMLAMLR